MVTNIINISNDIIEIAKEKCKELYRKFIMVGKNQENYIILSYDDSSYIVSIYNNDFSNLKQEMISLTEEEALKNFYVGRFDYRLEIISNDIPFNYSRLLEITNDVIACLRTNDEDFALDYFNEIMDLSDFEKEYLDIPILIKSSTEAYLDEMKSQNKTILNI